MELISAKVYIFFIRKQISTGPILTAYEITTAPLHRRGAQQQS